jgi:hypothetical protein
VKNTLSGIHSRLDTEEEKVNELENKNKMISPIKHKVKVHQKNKQQ